jgi:hypothetical protein
LIVLDVVRPRVESWAAESGRQDGLDLERCICFETSHGLIDGCCYLFFDRAGSPRLAAKFARTPAGRAVLATEHANLGILERIGINGARRSTPEPLGSWPSGQDLVTLQTALTGKLLKNEPGRRLFSAGRGEATVGRVVAWWTELQRRFGLKRVVLSGRVYDSEVLSHVRRFAGWFRPSPAELELLEARFERERRLAGMELPFMVRHGDFCPANMVVEGDAGFGVFDWEFPLSHETPLFDLFYFFASTRYPYSGLHGESSHFESFVEVLWGRGPLSAILARKAVEACREFDVPREALGDLLLLSCMQLANMKYEGYVTSLGETPERGPLDEEAKASRWRAFPPMDLPFGCIRDGRLANLGVFVERGFPWWCECSESSGL